MCLDTTIRKQTQQTYDRTLPKNRGWNVIFVYFFLWNTFLPTCFNKFLKTCTRFTTTMQIMYIHTMLHVISFNIHIETLLSKLSISNMTREIIEKIIEWDIISKCLFGADFAKCKKIITNC
jgi:hypothetical protein